MFFVTIVKILDASFCTCALNRLQWFLIPASTKMQLVTFPNDALDRAIDP